MTVQSAHETSLNGCGGGEDDGIRFDVSARCVHSPSVLGLGEPLCWSVADQAIAQALGCDGVRVSSTNELRAAIESVSKLTRPLVIDVPLSLKTSFQDVTQKFDGH